MSTQFALDLRVARRKAGLTQRDVAHLLAAHQSAVSDLERGRIRPGLTQIVTLSLIYGRSFECLFAELIQEARRDLLERLETLPKEVRSFAGTFNRPATLERLRHRLTAELKEHGGAADLRGRQARDTELAHHRLGLAGRDALDVHL
ncbi:MAG: XRE family transcriptional regulator, partial [Alphaproteobacteria bacterium]